MKALFWNTEERRVRALWRIILYVAFVIVSVLAIMLASAVLFGLLRTSETVDAVTLLVLQGIVLTLVSWLGFVIFARQIDRRPYSDYGFMLLEGAWWRDLVFGMVLGALLMAGIVLVGWLLGWMELGAREAGPSGNFWPGIIVATLLFTGVGFYEEMLTRGYLIPNIAEGLSRFGHRTAVIASWVLTSAIFGVLHAANPGADVISTFNITLAGIWLGIGYVLTRSLAIPIGAHITWNFVQGNVFGFAVSGTDAGATFFTTTVTGPEFWTGGAFGPERGLLGLLALLLGTVIVWGYVRMVYGRADIDDGIAAYTPPANF